MKVPMGLILFLFFAGVSSGVIGHDTDPHSSDPQYPFENEKNKAGEHGTYEVNKPKIIAVKDGEYKSIPSQYIHGTEEKGNSKNGLGVSLSDIGPFNNSAALFFIDATLGHKQDASNNIKGLIGKFLDSEENSQQAKTKLRSNVIKSFNEYPNSRKKRAAKDDPVLLMVKH
ncbi:uncharacterized protein LOC101855345 [Aplysia californica]|uniref:Uncharacterized protein LOC101855345 n=1 Tax=Aplysia californica TaxID=6500 RepID=A0ABM0JSP3_APLCA|nr:uncharacterized protein LOC101855345 [Aplysia californica]